MTFQQDQQRISAKTILRQAIRWKWNQGKKSPKLEGLGQDVYFILNIKVDDKQGLILPVIAST